MNTNFVIVDSKKQLWKKEIELLKANQHLQENERKSKMLASGGVVIASILYFTIVVLERRNIKLSQQ